MKFAWTDRRFGSGCQQPIASAKGLSLIETLVAVCILSVMTGMAMVTLGPLWQRHVLYLASKDLKQQIQLLRLKAIIDQTPYQVRISEGCLYFRRKDESDWGQWQRYGLNPRVAYTMAGVSYFYSRGFASPKTITLRYGPYHRKIIVNINGRARFAHGD